MKSNELRNIIPFKYNSFYTVHNIKVPKKNDSKNLPMIKTFSRNFNNDLKKIRFSLTQENSSNKNNNYNNSTKKHNEWIDNKGKMSQNNYFRLTNYIRNKYGKNMTKIKNKFSTPNKIKEIKLNVNKTECNKFNKKCFRVEVIQNQNPKTKNKLIENIHQLSVEQIYNIQKDEFKNSINSIEKRNNFINNYSSIIYYQIYPRRMINNAPSNGNFPNFFNHFILTNLKKSFNLSSKNKQNLLIKDNFFIEMIIENITRKVEYRNQKNERITIGLVKNLLYEELDIISDKLNFNFNQGSTRYNNNYKINKSTSTNEINELKFLNKTYDKFSYVTTNPENIEEKIKKKIENRLNELNEKYGFMNGSDNVLMYNKILTEDSLINNKNYQVETDKDLKIKSKRKKIIDDEEENNKFGDLIWAMADYINNMEEYKKKIFDQDKDNIFQNKKLRNIFGKELFIKKNKKFREFITKNFLVKKNIDFNDFQNNIQKLYEEYNSMKEEENKKLLSEIKTQNKKERKKTEEKNFDINMNNIDKLNKKFEKEKKPEIHMRISTNMNMENILSLINNNQQYEQLINGFGGYYAHNEEKDILKKLKDSNPNKNNIRSIYKEIKTNIIKEKEESKNLKRKFYISKDQDKGTKTYYINSSPKKRNSNNDNNFDNIGNSINYDDNDNYNDGGMNPLTSMRRGSQVLQTANSKGINNDNKINDEKTLLWELKPKEKKNKKNIKKKTNMSNEIKEIHLLKEKNKRMNDSSSIENKNAEILEEKSFKEEKKEIFKDELNDQEKEDIRNNKTTNKIDKELKIKNLKNENYSEINMKKDKFDLEHVKTNKNLNSLEKDFVIKTNFLSDLEKNDREQILQYLGELEELSKKEISIFIKSKINNLHYLIKNFIVSLFEKFNKPNSGENKEEIKRKKIIFNSIRKKEFLEKQKKTVEFKAEEEEENEINIPKEIKGKIKNKRFSLDADFKIIFEKSRKRSRSFNIKILKSYPKLYHNLLFNIIQDKESSLSRAHTPKKDLMEDEWEKYLMKTSINKRRIINVKTSKFVKRKKKAIRNAKKTLFIDEYKNIKNIIIQEKDEEIENIKDEIKRNKLKKEMVEKKLYEFFDKIKALKKVEVKNYEKELELLVDEQLDKLEYSKAKENESRVNNFIQEFDLNRTKNIFSKKFHSKRMHYLSPIVFSTKQNEENNMHYL